MKNGKLVATLGAVALVAAVGLGSTLAYLTDTTNNVTNTFVMGNVTFNDDPALKGGLVEHTIVVKDNGYELGTDWTDENIYEKVTPGEKLPKDPTAFVGVGSEDAYLYVLVSNSTDYSKIEYTDEFKDGKVATVKDADKKEYTLYRAKDIVKAPKKDAVDPGHKVFSNVTVRDDIEFTADGKITYKNGNDVVTKAALDQITVKAALVQSDNIDVEAADEAAIKLLKVTVVE